MLFTKNLRSSAPLISSMCLMTLGVACTSAPRKPDSVATAAVGAQEPPLAASPTVQSEDLPALPETAPALDSGALTDEIQQEIEQEVRTTDASLEPTPHTGVPMEINEHVERWVHFFSVKDRVRFTSFVVRGARYRALVQGILKENGIPAELYYLAMIESGFVTHARSRVSAVGAWQFMRPTARLYGLKVDREVDERRDIVRSTRAAARYLKRLHDEFQSWYLTMAAYNAGEGRIRSAIRRGGSTDFWQLVQRRAMPRETMEYVPKFLAASLIGKNPEKYGIQEGQVVAFPEVKRVSVPGATDLRKLARLADLPVNLMTELNPHLLAGRTPRRASYDVWVPSEQVRKVEQVKLAARPSREEARRARLAEAKIQAAERAQAAHGVRLVHRVRRGETLQSIARKYRVTARQLRKANQLRSNRVRQGQELRIAKNT